MNQFEKSQIAYERRQQKAGAFGNDPDFGRIVQGTISRGNGDLIHKIYLHLLFLSLLQQNDSNFLGIRMGLI